MDLNGKLSLSVVHIYSCTVSKKPQEKYCNYCKTSRPMFLHIDVTGGNGLVTALMEINHKHLKEKPTFSKIHKYASNFACIAFPPHPASPPRVRRRWNQSGVYPGP